MICNNCKNEVDDNAKFCSNCGAPIESKNNQVIQISENKVNSFGITGFVLGILSYFFNFLFCIPSILAICFSSISMKNNNNRGLTIAGLILGLISLILWLFRFLVIILNVSRS